MAKKTKKAEATQTPEVVDEEKANREMPKHRRYVGSRETTAYILYDIAQSLNLNSKRTYFITDVFVIALKWQTIINAITSVWDIVNDIFLAALVDRTNTRFGKFKPYLILYAGPGAALGILFWAMPKFFPGAAPAYMPKIVMYFVLNMVSNLVTSLYNIAKTGILATITPDTLDRTRLINQANLISSLVENIPKQAITIFIDLVNREVMKVKMTSLFVVMGIATAAASSALGFYFAVIFKERVLQSVEKPTQKESLSSIVKSRPLMLLAISDLLSAFSISTDLSLYYINVLNFSSAELVVGIPGMPVTYLSYAYVNKLREKFSTKLLWIVGDHMGGFLLLLLAGGSHHLVEKTMKSVEWATIFFFIGLFIAVGGLVETGVIHDLAVKAIELTGGDVTATSLLVLWLSALVSSVLDNIPFVATMIPLIQSMGQMGVANLDPIWWSLALGACLGGNGTLVGASANLIVAGLAAERGVKITFLRYLL